MHARAIAPLLFLSGAASLILEVCWFRRIAQVAGGTAVAMSAVLAAVIGGMAIGSWLFGSVADRSRRPLRMYALMELGVAGFALLTPTLINAAGEAFATTTAMQFALAVLLLAPPAVLMGGTLPAVTAALRAPDGRSIGWLYAANTLGAVGGTVAAGFFLIPTLGLAMSMRSAAVLSGAAGLMALRMAKTREVPEFTAASASGSGRAIWLFAVSGFMGLVAEVAFTRQLVLVFGSSTYAFSTMLAVFLLGIGVGGIIGTRFRTNHLRKLEWTVAITGAAFALSALAVYALPRFYILGLLEWGDSFDAGLRLRVALTAAVLLPGAIGLGIAFPLAAHAAGRTGTSTGKLYAANTFASVLGSTLAVFLFIPSVGPHLTIVGVAIVAGLLCGRRRLPIVLIAACGLIPVSDVAQEHLNAGIFFFPAPYIEDGEIDEYLWDEGVDLNYTAYGRESTVSICQWFGKNSILIDGKAVATNQILADVHHLSLLGHLPMAVHPDPKRVLVVGLGLGTTYRAVQEHKPDVLRVVEIEDAVVQTAKRLDVNPKDLVVTDARTYLKRTRETFDVITSDPIHPWVRGGGDLYSAEYYELVKRRLAPGGVACQWLPVYQISTQNVFDTIRTFSEVFHTDLYFGGGDMVLVGTLGTPPPRARTLALESLKQIGAQNLSELLVARHESLRAIGGELLIDDELRLEYQTPRHVDSRELTQTWRWIQTLWKNPPKPYGGILRFHIAWADGNDRTIAREATLLKQQFNDHGYVRMLLGEDHLTLADGFMRDERFEQAEEQLAIAEEYLPGDERIVGTRAGIFERSGNRAEARRLYEQLLRRNPDSAFTKRKIEAMR